MFKLSLVLYLGLGYSTLGVEYTLPLYFWQFKRLLAVTDVLYFETMIDLKLLDKLYRK